MLMDRLARRLSEWEADRSEPVLETTVGDALREAAAIAPDLTALVEGAPGGQPRRRWTYAQLLAEAQQAARALATRFEPGERVAVWAPNIPEWVILEFGAALAGVTLVTVNPAYRPEELAYVLKQSNAVGIFLVPEFRSPMLAFLDEVRAELPALREVVLFTNWAEFLQSSGPNVALPAVSPDAIAQIQYTSGTTGFPKGALLHHRGLTNNARLVMNRAGLKQGDTYVNTFPLFHTAGCALGVLGAVQSRAAFVTVEAFEPGLVLELIESERSAIFLGVPTALLAMLDHPDFARRDLSSLRFALCGGSPVPPDLVRRVESALDIPLNILYGTTECSPIITQVEAGDSADDRANTLGRPLPQTEVRITDLSTGEPTPIGAVGELCARGYLVMAGYNDAPEATAAAIDRDGWYHTGDLASMDERGFVRIEGRAKDMIIRGGENIYPREIENVLFAHPHVADVAVVGVPDEHWGEIVAAFIRTRDIQPTEDDLRAYCRQHLAPYKTPKLWAFVDSFPLTPSGKVQKYKLRESLRRSPQLRSN
jgi:fatty-acyl-CoA synthase